VKSVLNGRRFEAADEIKETSLAEQRSTTKKGIPGMLPKLEETLGKGGCMKSVLRGRKPIAPK
jgi:hypothetical protein